MKNRFRLLNWVAAGLLAAGCATHLSKPAHEPVPSKVKFGEFQAVEMKSVSLNPAFAGSGANEKARKKIDELLFENMKKPFPNLKRVEKFSTGSTRTLQITPNIKEIKFIGGAARFWVGAMAGSSAVLMQVTYVDGSNGQTIADPEFYAQANAMGGAWTMGGTDNLMLERIEMDIVGYSIGNK